MRVAALPRTLAVASLCVLLGSTCGQAGILDAVPGAEAGYSLRQLTSTYAGPAVNVRRASDGATQDIGFVNGQLDTDSLLGFANGGSAMLLLVGVLTLLAGRRLRMVRKASAMKACATIAVLAAVGCTAAPNLAVSAPIYFDFGQSTHLSPSGSYNNVTSATSTGQKISDAIDADGTNTGIGLSVTERFHESVTNGIASSAAGFHQNAQRDSFYVRDGSAPTYPTAAVRLEALHPHLLYDIVLFGSRSSADEMTDRYTVYTIDGLEQVLDTKGNTSNVVTFSSVVPSSSGHIDIGARLLTNADTALLAQLGIASTDTDHGYLSAMKVTTDGIVKYSTAGQVFTESFDALANSPHNTTQPWSNNSTLPGWYFSRANGGLASTYTIFDGDGAKQNVLLSLGQTGDTDRALGFQSSSAAGTVHYGFRMENNTPMTLDEFHLGYTGEQWRAVNSSDPSRILFEYQVFDSGEGNLLAASGWTAIDSLEFVAPHYHGDSSDNRGLDGNDPDNREVLHGMAMDVPWGPGQELWLRWTDIHPPHQMMGIDDVWFRAIPEPGSLVLLLMGILAFLLYRRR